MINLLPLSEKQKIYRMYLARLSIVMCTALFVVFIAACFLIFPAFFISHTKVKQLQMDVLKEQESSSFKEREIVERLIDETNNHIAILSRGDEILPSETLRAVLERKGSGVTLSDFILQKNPDQKGYSFSFEGIAKDREALLAFVDRVKAHRLFASVELPVSNLVKSRDIPFFIHTSVGALGAQNNILKKENAEE